MEKTCARCKGSFVAPEADKFITCPGCRRPLKASDMRPIRMRTLDNRMVDESCSPMWENSIRSMEG